jgi:hypothetical protein
MDDNANIAPIINIRKRMKRPTASLGIYCGNPQKVRKWQARRSIAWFFSCGPGCGPEQKTPLDALLKSWINA